MRSDVWGRDVEGRSNDEEGAIGFAAWVQETGLAPNIPYLNLKKFKDTAEEI